MSETKTFKGYQCQISKTPIFWNINSIDKPSKQFFNSYVEWDNVNFTPNFIDQFTVNIVADSDKYTLLKIYEIYETVDSEKPDETATSWENEKIYINSNVSKILKKGFLLKFDLDIFATYFYDLTDYLKSNNYYLKVNRLFNYKIMESDFIESVIWKNDPLLDYSNCGYIPISKVIQKWESTNPLISTVYEASYIAPDTKYFVSANNYIKAEYDNTFSNENDYPYLIKAKTYMYQLENGLYIGFVETLPTDNKYYTGTDIILTDSNNSTKTKTRVSALNLHNMIQSKVDWLQNKFIGIWNIDWLEYTEYLYLFQCQFYTSATDATLIKYSNGNNTIPIIMFRPEDSIKLSSSLSKKTIYLNTSANYNIYNPTAKISINNVDNKPNYYVFAKCTYENWNKPFLNPLLSWQNNGIVTFNGDTFNFYYNYQLDNSKNTWTNFKYKYCDIMSWYSTIAVAISSYTEYINSVKSTQNTNLQIAKQQSTMGIVGNVLSGVTGVASAVMSGNVIGGISSLTNSAMGIANSVLKYQNTQKKIDAENEDKYRVAKANNINSNSVTDDMLNKLNSAVDYKTRFIFSEIYNIKFPDSIQSIVMNKLIGKYGFYIGQDLQYSQVEDSITPENDTNNIYTIIDFEIDELILRQFLPNENVELIYAIKIILNNSLRIWTKYMDINTQQPFSLPESL